MEKLKEVEDKIRKTGAEVLSVKCDVSIQEDCKNLTEQTIAKFG